MDEDEDEPSHYDPVSCTGLQPGSNVFVFGPNFQLFADGSVKRQFVWVESIIQKLQRPVNPLPPLPNYPLQHLSVLVQGVHTIAGDNVISGVYLLGEVIYEWYTCAYN